MGDYSWMKRFKVEAPGDREYIEAMGLMYGTHEDDRITAERCLKAMELFRKGALMGNLRCVNQMHYCYEGRPGIPYDPVEWQNWIARYRALQQGEPDWLEWDWKREIERGWQQDPEMQKKPLEFWLEKYRPRKREGT